jgi:hypothetical protein
MPDQDDSRVKTIAQISLFIVLLPVIAPLFLIAITFIVLYESSLYLLIWLLWFPRGKDVLFVSSNSPIWNQYMTDQVLPLVAGRAVILNWSERKSWPRWSLAKHFFRACAGHREFNPMVVVFRPLRRAVFFRFYVPLKHLKHGNAEPVEWLRQELADCVGSETERVAKP